MDLNDIRIVIIHLSNPKNYRFDSNFSFFIIFTLPTPTLTSKSVLEQHWEHHYSSQWLQIL